MKKTIEILDTTLREGEQTNNVSFSTKQKIEIVKLLDKIGVDFIEVGHPAISKKIAKDTWMIPSNRFTGVEAKLHLLDCLGSFESGRVQISPQRKRKSGLFIDSQRIKELKANTSKKYERKRFGIAWSYSPKGEEEKAKEIIAKALESVKKVRSHLKVWEAL